MTMNIFDRKTQPLLVAMRLQTPAHSQLRQSTQDIDPLAACLKGLFMATNEFYVMRPELPMSAELVGLLKALKNAWYRPDAESWSVLAIAVDRLEADRAGKDHAVDGAIQTARRVLYYGHYRRA